MKVLHAAAEVFPLVKTGGLADVLGALPQALVKAGVDARLVLPGFPAIKKGVLKQKLICDIGAAQRRERREAPTPPRPWRRTTHRGRGPSGQLFPLLR